MIYMVTHDKESIPNQDPGSYYPLRVGDLYNYPESHENINHLNPYINELTGLYYLWKNVEDEYIGLAHYRRVFVEEYGSNRWMSLITAKNILRDCDMIIHRDYSVPISIYNQLRLDLYPQKELLDKYMEILYKEIPEAEEYYTHTRIFNPRNMFICKKEIMDQYCEWLFPKIIPITKDFTKENNVQNKRLLGFVFERLLTLWIQTHDIHYKDLFIKQF